MFERNLTDTESKLLDLLEKTQDYDKDEIMWDFENAMEHEDLTEDDLVDWLTENFLPVESEDDDMWAINEELPLT